MLKRRFEGAMAGLLVWGPGVVGWALSAGCGDAPDDGPPITTGGAGADPSACTHGERRCDGPVLQLCNATLSSWIDEHVCASVTLCNAREQRCDPPRCQPGQHNCDGRKLQECHPERTHYENDRDYPEPCAEICDAAEGQCDLCVPEMQICSEDERNLSQCESDGQAYRIVHTCEPDEVCVESPPTAQCSPAGSGGMGGMAGAGG